MPEQNTLIKAKCLLIVHHEHYSGHEHKHMLKVLKMRHYVVICINTEYHTG